MYFLCGLGLQQREAVIRLWRLTQYSGFPGLFYTTYVIFITNITMILYENYVSVVDDLQYFFLHRIIILFVKASHFQINDISYQTSSSLLRFQNKSKSS